MKPFFRKALEDDKSLYVEGKGSEKTSNKLEDIVPAAFNGRIDILFIEKDRQEWGVFDPERNRVIMDGEGDNKKEDLLDFAAAHTILNRGCIHSVSREEMPDEKAMAAVYRY